MPGLSAFLEASSNLTELTLTCNSIIAAAQAVYFHSSCSQVTHVRSMGLHRPSTFPVALTKLQVDFCTRHCSTMEVVPWDPQVLTAFIYQIGHHQHLKDLRLDFRVSDIQLVCPVSLPKLEKLTISFTLVDDLALDLSWLRQQPCEALIVHITVITAAVARHQQVVEQLLAGQLSKLELCWCTELPPALQALWQQLSPSHLFALVMMSRAALTSVDKALQALPVCPNVLIFYPPRMRGQPLYVDWGAVTQAGKFEIYVQEAHDFHLLGGRSSPPNIQGTWQLQVTSAQDLEVHGPRGSVDAKSMMQNSAAISAGWTARIGKPAIMSEILSSASLL